MRTNRTTNRNLVLIVFVVLGLITLAAAVHAGWSNLAGADCPDQGASKDESADLIFADGFETGDTTAWGPYAPQACPTPTLDLPTPAKR